MQASAVDAVAVMELGRGKASDSVAQAKSAGGSLEKINLSVASINDMNAQIATAAEQQSQVVKEVLSNMTSIKNVADTTAGDAQSGEARAKVLQDHAFALNDKVATFKL